MAPYEDFAGIYASTIVPFNGGGEVDDRQLAQHVAGVAATEGVRGLLVNGHAGENFTLAPGEKKLVVEVVRQAIGPRAKIISGVNAESSSQAASDAREAEMAGANAILVFPPFSWMVPQAPEVAIAHHRAVLEATSLPIMLYCAPVGTGALAYPPALLRELALLPRVAGVKEGSWETTRYEANLRLLNKVAPQVLVMPSSDEHLLSCFVLGGRGSQVSIAAIMPETVVELDRAIANGDLPAARAAHDAIWPLAQAIYGTAPAGRATARIKACLQILGRLPSAAMRRPFTACNSDECALLEKSLKAAGVR
ncbi:dihydrodipicolinate synthase family protein [Mesorhizobium sp.]|uniref:dihydrodipicolinate synthase family protein n=1 Tax=Mesorhizobium sp. TaxID=1871066 RepID=UPI000FE6511A|nr:dihydrodipicolinate synthase family protein [Mesorhizobium sp.]RWI88931.1 MAG: dihydrodipicolinate synthase family protein [Mesorhizobium sp.]